MSNTYEVTFPFKPIYESKDQSSLETVMKRQQMVFLNLIFREKLSSLSDVEVALHVREMITDAVLTSKAYDNASDEVNALWHYLAFQTLEVVWNASDARRESLDGIPERLCAGFKRLIIPLKEWFPVLTRYVRDEAAVLKDVRKHMDGQAEHYGKHYKEDPKNAPLFVMVEHLKSLAAKKQMKQTCYTIRWHEMHYASSHEVSFVTLLYMKFFGLGTLAPPVHLNPKMVICCPCVFARLLKKDYEALLQMEQRKEIFEILHLKLDVDRLLDSHPENFDEQGVYDEKRGADIRRQKRQAAKEAKAAKPAKQPKKK